MRPPPCPGDSFVLFEQFWLEKGPLQLPALGRDDDGAARRFVLTPSVRGQLHNLARCILARRHPILLQVHWGQCWAGLGLGLGLGWALSFPPPCWAHCGGHTVVVRECAAVVLTVGWQCATSTTTTNST